MQKITGCQLAKMNIFGCQLKNLWIKSCRLPNTQKRGVVQDSILTGF